MCRFLKTTPMNKTIIISIEHGLKINGKIDINIFYVIKLKIYNYHIKQYLYFS